MYECTPLAVRRHAAIHTPHASGYTAGKPRGPVRSNTTSEAVAAPTGKRGFVMPEFPGLVRMHGSDMVSGGMGLPVRMAARLRTCLKHPAHLMRVQTQTVDFLATPEGAKTMSRVIHLASRRAVHITGTTDPIEAFAEAHNALSMALHYLRQPSGNLPGATRKAVQALAALRRLDASTQGGAA